MKKAIQGFLIVAVFIGAIGGLVYYTKASSMRAKAELNKVVKPMIHAMVENQWNIRVMNQYASPQLKAAMKTSAKRFAAVMKYMRMAGPIEQYNGIRNLSFSKHSKFPKATVGLRVNFAAGRRVLVLELIKPDERWLLNSFSVVKAARKRPGASPLTQR